MNVKTETILYRYSKGWSIKKLSQYYNISQTEVKNKINIRLSEYGLEWEDIHPVKADKAE